MPIEITNEHPTQPRGWTVTESVEDYLAKHNIPYTTATPLAGGHSAYVWRIDGFFDSSTKDKGQPCVLKYAEEVAKGAPQFTMDANRMLFEARALESRPVAKACEQEPSVQVPSVLSATDQALLMSWAGDIDLRSAYMEKCLDFDVGKVGARLGRWIAAVHIGGLSDAEVSTWTDDITEAFTTIEVKNLRTILAADGMESPNVEEVVQMLVLPAGSKTLISWDFRPMNTLLRFGENPSDEPSLTIVDWECARYGCPVDDLRLWTAEALVLESKHGTERNMVSSFLTAYRLQAGTTIVTKDFVCKLALSVGSIMLQLVPSGLWTSDQSEIDFWTSRAKQFIRAASRRDMQWLSASEFAPLFSASKI